jgi:formyl-CoA transferase
MSLFGAVMLALFARERTGRGTKVTTSLLANGVWSNAASIQAQLCGATFHPKVPRERAPALSVYYRTRDDRALKFSFVNPAKLWPRLCAALERPDLLTDVRFADGAQRRANAGALMAILDPIFAAHDAAYWKRRLEAHDLPFAILPTYAEIAADEQLHANGLLPEMDHPRFGALRTVDNPISVEGIDKRRPRAAPELGQHTAEILAELGYSTEEVARFTRLP